MATESTGTGTTTPIVVAISATRRCGETLEMASALAAHIGTDLEVIFVEDENLLRIADLPVAREIDRLSGMTREIDSGRMLQALQGEARRLRHELARLTASSAVRSTVRVVRGQILSEALTASARVEVTFVHGLAHTLLGAPPPSRPTRAPIPSTLATTPVRKPVWTLFEGGSAGVRALSVAAKLTRALGCRLTVLLPHHGGDDAGRLEREARAIVDETELRFLQVAENRAVLRGRLLVPGDSSLLVLAKQSPELEDAAVRTYLESLPVPLVLVA